MLTLGMAVDMTFPRDGLLACAYDTAMPIDDLNPDYEDPLDSSLALEFYQASGTYEASVMEYTQRYARAETRASWQCKLEGGAADVLPHAPKVPEVPTVIKFLKADEASITIGWAAPEKYADGSPISGEPTDSLVELQYEVGRPHPNATLRASVGGARDAARGAERCPPFLRPYVREAARAAGVPLATMV